MHLRSRRARTRRLIIFVMVLVLAAACLIGVLAYLGLYLRACLIASSLLSLFSLCYAAWIFHVLQDDTARLKREVARAQRKLSTTALASSLVRGGSRKTNGLDAGSD